MFYLTHLLKIFKTYPLRSFSFVCLSLLIIFLSVQKNLVDSAIHNAIPEKKEGDYFYVLIHSHEFSESIVQKISQMPGIYKITTQSDQSIEKELKTIYKENDLTEEDVALMAQNLKFHGLKVIFNPKANNRQILNVREYFSKLLNVDQFILGNLVTVTEKHDPTLLLIEQVQNGAFYILLCTVALLWMIFALSLKTKIQEIAYLLNRYQRRKKIGHKLYLTSSMLIALVSIPFTLLGNQPNYGNWIISLLLLTSFSLTFLREKKNWYT